MFGYPRARRVRKRPDFVRIQSSSVRISTAHLLLLLAPSVPPGPARLGVVASKKVGGAVERNRVKRLVREAFRLNPGVFPDGVDVVVIVRPGTHLCALGDLERELVRASSQIARRAAGLCKIAE